MNTGPGRNSNSFVRWLKTFTPVTSDGQQVGRELQPRERAVDRARERLGQHRLPDAREVLDDQVTLGDEAEHAQAQRLVGRVDDVGEVVDDPLDRVGGRGVDRLAP